MGQRTKWGNCSSLGNLCFNWRLVMVSNFVLRCIVTHEMAHLAIPDHSRKFWLTIPLRQDSCRPDRTDEQGAMMRERVGSIRTSIQGQGGGDFDVGRAGFARLDTGQKHAVTCQEGQVAGR